MAKLAVDVVLLPPDSLAAQAIEINRRLVALWKSAIVLDRESCLPHISLAMGCLEEADLTRAAGVLEELARPCAPLRLKALRIVTIETAGGRKVSQLEIERTPELQRLHESVMKKVARYLTSEVTADTLVSPGEVDEGALFWIRNYSKVASFELFSPHLTLGYGQADAELGPTDFTAATLALFHLGNHCTCRKVLYAVELG